MSKIAFVDSVESHVSNLAAAAVPNGSRRIVGMIVPLLCLTAVPQVAAAPNSQNDDRPVISKSDAAGLALEAESEAADDYRQTVTPDGVTVITLANGSEVRFAPADSAEALAASCGKDNFCLWTGKNYKGDKVTFTQLGSGICWMLRKGHVLPVKSLIAGSNRGSTMWTKRKCKGTASPTYSPGARVPDTGYKNGFQMRAIR